MNEESVPSHNYCYNVHLAYWPRELRGDSLLGGLGKYSGDNGGCKFYPNQTNTYYLRPYTPAHETFSYP